MTSTKINHTLNEQIHSINNCAMTATRYRIYDRTDDEILANELDKDQAQETLDLLYQIYPNNELEIESYTTTRHKGLGRDPDLYND